MQHIMLDATFRFSDYPFPAFRGGLCLGRNKHDGAFVATRVPPVPHWLVIPESVFAAPILTTPDRCEAERAAEEYARQHQSGPWPYTAMVAQGTQRLVRDTFRVIRTRDGTTVIVPGEDTTPRVLAGIGETGGFRGGIAVEECTATVLAEVAASTKIKSRRAMMALFSPGQYVAFRSWGRHGARVVCYQWDGVAVQTLTYSPQEWAQRDIINASVDGAEVL